MKKRYLCLLLIHLLLISLSVKCYANYIITSFTHKTFCTSSYPTTYQSVGQFILTEGANADFDVQTNKTMVLTLPAGFEFNTAVGPAVTFTAGRNITALTFTWTTTAITVTITVGGTNRIDAIQFNNFQVRAIAVAGGDLTRTGGTFTINGSSGNPTSSESFGRLDTDVPTSYVSSTVVQASTADIVRNCSSRTSTSVARRCA